MRIFRQCMLSYGITQRIYMNEEYIYRILPYFPALKDVTTLDFFRNVPLPVNFLRLRMELYNSNRTVNEQLRSSELSDT